MGWTSITDIAALLQGFEQRYQRTVFEKHLSHASNNPFTGSTGIAAVEEEVDHLAHTFCQRSRWRLCFLLLGKSQITTINVCDPYKTIAFCCGGGKNSIAGTLESRFACTSTLHYSANTIRASRKHLFLPLSALCALAFLRMNHLLKPDELPMFRSKTTISVSSFSCNRRLRFWGIHTCNLSVHYSLSLPSALQRVVALLRRFEQRANATPITPLIRGVEHRKATRSQSPTCIKKYDGRQAHL